MMPAHRFASRSIICRSSCADESAGTARRTRCAKVMIAMSGLFSSCAMPAATSPTDDSFSACTTWKRASVSSRAFSATFSSSVSAQSSSWFLELCSDSTISLNERARSPISRAAPRGTSTEVLPSATRRVAATIVSSGRRTLCTMIR